MKLPPVCSRTRARNRLNRNMRGWQAGCVFHAHPRLPGECLALPADTALTARALNRNFKPVNFMQACNVSPSFPSVDLARTGATRPGLAERVIEQ